MRRIMMSWLASRGQIASFCLLLRRRLQSELFFLDSNLKLDSDEFRFVTSGKRTQVLPHMPPDRRKFVHDVRYKLPFPRPHGDFFFLTTLLL